MPIRVIIRLNTSSLSSSYTSISISPASTRFSLQKREKIVCHTNGSTSVISVIYAQHEPTAEPRPAPNGIPSLRASPIKSLIDSINPSIPTFLNTVSSSLILSTYSCLRDLSIIPCSIFWSSRTQQRFTNSFSSSSFDLEIGYLKLLSSSKSSTLSAMTFVLLSAIAISSSDKTPCSLNI